MLVTLEHCRHESVGGLARVVNFNFVHSLYAMRGGNKADTLEEEGAALQQLEILALTLTILYDPHRPVPDFVRSWRHLDLLFREVSVETNSNGPKHRVGLAPDVAEPADFAFEMCA